MSGQVTQQMLDALLQKIISGTTRVRAADREVYTADPDQLMKAYKFTAQLVQPDPAGPRTFRTFRFFDNGR